MVRRALLAAVVGPRLRHWPVPQGNVGKIDLAAETSFVTVHPFTPLIVASWVYPSEVSKFVLKNGSALANGANAHRAIMIVAALNRQGAEAGSETDAGTKFMCAVGLGLGCLPHGLAEAVRMTENLTPESPVMH